MTDDPTPIRVDGLSLGLGERTGAEVEERTVDGRPAWVAIFAGLRAGGYQVVGPWSGQEARVEVAPGRVTELDWREPASP